jgi:hypothetical protein
MACKGPDGRYNGGVPPDTSSAASHSNPSPAPGADAPSGGWLERLRQIPRVVLIPLAIAIIAGIASGVAVPLISGGSEPSSDTWLANSMAPVPKHSLALKTGGPVHTWSDYQTGQGHAGPLIPQYARVHIACRVTGYKVPQDQNPWWYRIASAPWNGRYFGSADAFYNGKRQSGSLHGTGFVDTHVPTC